MSLLDFWELYRDQGTIYAVIALLVFAVICLITPICKDKILYKIRHKRNIGYFLYGIIYAIVTLVLFKFDLVTFRGMMALIILDVLYLLICAYTVNYELPYARHMLKKHEQFLDEGLAAEHIDYFKSKHWYISETTEKIAFARLKGRYYADIGSVKEAFDAFNEVDVGMLYEREQTDFAVIKAMMLWELGDFSASSRILDNDTCNDHPAKYMILSFISEQAGDLDRSFDEIKKAKDLCNIMNIVPVYKIQVFENFGRTQLLRGNKSEAILYMQLANRELEKLQKPRADLQKTVKGNLISLETTMNGDTPHVRSLLDDYKKQLPAESIGNNIEYNNCCVEFFRQIGDTRAAYDCIKNGYFELIKKLDFAQTCHFQASTFQMIMNGGYVHDWLDIEIEKTYSGYTKLSVVDKILVYKVFWGILQQPEYYCLRRKEAYKELHAQIKRYYTTSAITDIDEYMATLDAHEIYKRGQIMQDKLAILKYLERDKHIERSKQYYIDLYKMWTDAGLQIAAVNTLIILVEECMSADNVRVSINGKTDTVTYQEYLESVPMGPDPILLKNGYQLLYASLNLDKVQPFPQEIPLMEEQLKVIIPIVMSWENYPAKYDFSLRIARSLMALGRKEEAKEFVGIFESSGLSIEHYAEWVKDDYYLMKAELAAESTTNSQS